jgi:hypothetical protein
MVAQEVIIGGRTPPLVSEWVACLYSETNKWAEMKLDSADWSLDSSKHRFLLVSRFLALPKFISRAFCVAGITIEEQGKECLQN